MTPSSTTPQTNPSIAPSGLETGSGKAGPSSQVVELIGIMLIAMLPENFSVDLIRKVVNKALERYSPEVVREAYEILREAKNPEAPPYEELMSGQAIASEPPMEDQLQTEEFRPQVNQGVFSERAKPTRQGGAPKQIP